MRYPVIIACAFGLPASSLHVQYRAGEDSDWLEAEATCSFSIPAAFDLTVIADLQCWSENETWLKGARVSLSGVNLFNERQTVVDAAAARPCRYRPGYLTPTGRFVRFELPKLF